MTTKLPIHLEDLRIATPCLADWNEMVGDDQVRFCGKCEKNVYNVIAMTRDAAESLVREKEGQLCVRLWKRADGTVLTADCPVGVRKAKLRQRMWASVTGAVASVGLMLGLLSGRARADLSLKHGDKATAQPKPPMMMAGAPYRPPTPIPNVDPPPKADQKAKTKAKAKAEPVKPPEDAVEVAGGAG